MYKKRWPVMCKNANRPTSTRWGAMPCHHWTTTETLLWFHWIVNPPPRKCGRSFLGPFFTTTPSVCPSVPHQYVVEVVLYYAETLILNPAVVWDHHMDQGLRKRVFESSPFFSFILSSSCSGTRMTWKEVGVGQCSWLSLSVLFVMVVVEQILLWM